MAERLLVDQGLDTSPDAAVVKAAAAALRSRAASRHGARALRNRRQQARPRRHPEHRARPGDIAQAHTDDEWVSLAEVASAAEVYARLALDLPGARP